MIEPLDRDVPAEVLSAMSFAQTIARDYARKGGERLCGPRLL
jgi:hypothetical protein